MKRVRLIGGIAAALLAVLMAGCGGSATSPVTSGKITGTVTRVLIPGMPEGEPIRTPYSDLDVEVYQGDVLRETSRTDAEGRFSISIPVGSYRVKPTDEIRERTAATIGSQDVTVTSDKTVPVELEVTIPGP